MQNSQQLSTIEEPRIPHDLVAYALGVKYSLVYNVRSGRRKDHYGVLDFVQEFKKSLEQTRLKNLEKRAEARKPAVLTASN